MDTYFKVLTFGRFRPEPMTQNSEHAPQAANYQHGPTSFEESVGTQYAGDICISIFLVIYAITWFLRSDSAAAIVFKYIGVLLTCSFMALGLFLEGPTLTLKITLAIVILVYCIGVGFKLTMSVRCNSWVPFCADEDSFVMYQSGGYNYCFPFDPNGPYFTVMVNPNSITCGSYTIYGSASLSDAVYVVTLTNKHRYSLQTTFDTGMSIIAFYVADYAIIENHTAVGNNLKIQLREELAYDVPSATINVPL